MKASKLFSYAIVFYFLIPYLIFVGFFKFDFSIDLTELLWAFRNSFTQAFLAAFFVTLLSVPASIGLLSLPSKVQKLTKTLLLIPQVLPSFFSILIAFSLWNPFPFGNLGITFIFVLVHTGFATVLLHAATVEKLGSYPMVAEVYSVKRGDFFKKIYFPLIRSALFSNFLLIFIFCFSSFAIPLIAGGGRDTNVEVLIFEKIFIAQKWSAAWLISFGQSAFLTFLSFVLVRQNLTVKLDFHASGYLKSWLGLGLIAIYLLVFGCGYGLGVLAAIPDFSKIILFKGDLLVATFRSAELLVVYLMISAGLLYAWLFDFVVNLKLSFARNLIAPSTMLVGFCFYLYFPQTMMWDFFKLPVAMSILVFPVLFKSFLEKPVLDLTDQVLTAKVFGISNHQIVIEVLIRRLQSTFVTWFAFVTIWFLSDFAVSRALGTRGQTLGLMAQNFLASYRLSLSYTMSLYILLVWFFVLLLFFFGKGVVRVAYQKFKFKF